MLSLWNMVSAGCMAANCGCKDCKHVREHVASLLPFKVLEAAAGKPLKIGGVAMAAGMSRNFAVYTPEELENLAPQLVGAPIYLEHVDVNNAAGKVTNAYFDKATKLLMYEGEIYDQPAADKIRNGLIQHVSVGADYASIDEFNAHAFHGLSNPELSLVAVPGFPETNIRIMEHLRESLRAAHGRRAKLRVKELLDPLAADSLTCVFCGAPGEYLVSTCGPCGDKAATQTNGSEKLELEEKDVDKIAEKVSVKVSEKSSVELEKVKNELAEALKKISDAEGKAKVAEAARDEANGKAVTAESKCAVAVKVAEDLKKLVPGVDLLANPPLLMPISEHISVLESLVPPAVVERSSMGMQRQCQAVRAAILKGKEKLGGK